MNEEDGINVDDVQVEENEAREMGLEGQELIVLAVIPIMFAVLILLSLVS